MISWETSSTTRFTSSLSSWEISAKICSTSSSLSWISSLKLRDSSSVFFGTTPCQPSSGGMPTNCTG